MEANSYLELRAQNIARNNKRLLELGLIKPIVEIDRNDIKLLAKNDHVQKSLRIKRPTKLSEATTRQCRTSPRLRNVHPPRNSLRYEESLKSKTSKKNDPNVDSSFKKTIPAPRSDSTRCTQIDLSAVLSSHLGKPVSCGKLSVIQRVSGKQLSFNKYR